MSAKLEIDLRLNAPQFTSYRWLFDDRGQVRRRRTIFLPWGRGVGKSWFRRQIWWTLVALFDGKRRADCPKKLRGVRITSLMPTLKQFRDVHWADIESELTGDGPWAWLGAKLDRQTCQITFPGGSWVKPFPASAYNARTSRGMRTDVLDADEVDDIDAAVYDAVAVPWLSEPWSLGIEVPGGTPTRGRHGLWFRFMQAALLGASLRAGSPPPPSIDAAAVEPLKTIYGQHATYRDAPETVSEQAVAKAKATTPKPTFEREWEANADAGEGLVHPFDEGFHVRAPGPLVLFSERIVGADHGFTDPGVFLDIGIQGNGRDATAWVLGELYETEKPGSWWDEQARLYPNRTFWCDRSRPDRIRDLRSRGDADARPADNAILPGIARVAEMLFRHPTEEGGEYAQLYIHPSCVNTIREFGLYRRAKRPDGTFSEQPEDRNNHAMDALRYALVGRFGFPSSERFETPGL